ncbi:MAG TPA: heavy metal translocating P-type ATPase [Polyangia bacterium]|nr:heavy metal translocating P-type ATPase [Polyangia bacterium]
MEGAGDALVCRHCGLASRSLLGGGSAYCCYGCELAAEIAAEAAQHKTRLKGVLTFGLLLSMLVMMLSLFLFAEDVYEAGQDPVMARLRGIYRGAAALLSTPVVVLCGGPLMLRAARALHGGRLTMELLVGTAAAAAYGLSLWNIAAGRPAVYFDSATSALMLVTLGRYLEASARARAAGLLGPSLEPAREPVLAGPGPGSEAGEPEEGPLVPTAPALLVPGMRVEVAVDQVVPVDVALGEGPVEVNLGVLTGEPAPRTMAVGERVPAGAVPVSGPLRGKALTDARDSTLGRLAELARSLRARSSRIERSADRFAAALVPLVWLAAFGALVWWTAHASFERGVVVALAVVLAACPCTYGVAIPLVLWLSLRKALEHGVLIRNAAVLERLARVRTVAFDKTGTLTVSTPAVRAVEMGEGLGREEALAFAAGLERGSRHPVARALVALAEREGVRDAAVVERRFVVGRGVRGRDAIGRELRLGSAVFIDEEGGGLAALGAGEWEGIWLTVEGRGWARFAVDEEVRPEAAAAVAALRAQGMGAVVLTGDAGGGARKVAQALGVPVSAGLSAADKVAQLGALAEGGSVAHARDDAHAHARAEAHAHAEGRAETHAHAHADRVAMVGDGLNDAPALASVGPSFALDGGSGLARGMAGVTLLRPDLRLVPWTLGLARRAVRLARRSLAVATIYNLLFLGLALCGALRPVWAGLSMLGSSLLTLASALRMGAFPGPEGSEASEPSQEAMAAPVPAPAPDARALMAEEARA